MADRSRTQPKRPRDMNQRAAFTMALVTGDTSADAPAIVTTPDPTPEQRHAAAVALGRLGGKKGGPARANKMTPEQRRESARKAAQARWKK
ncbi:MAG: histone H1 [Dehalococcoidia bacterium]|nr:histone H1 [Dehalococcoidia bacterium]